MKNKLTLLILILVSFNVFGKNVKLDIDNKLDASIIIKVFNGGKLDNLPISQNKLGQTTISSKSSGSLTIKVRSKDIISVVAVFQNGSEFLYWSGQIADQKNIDISINTEKFEFKNRPEDYLKNLQNDLYVDQDIEVIVEKTNTNASDVFKSHFGGLAIVEITTDEGKETIKEIDLIAPNVLKRNEKPKTVEDRVKNFKYTLDRKLITDNKVNIPAIANIDFDFKTDKLYSFSYSIVGFGKVIYTDPENKSIEERWASLTKVKKESFLNIYIASLNQVKDDDNKRIEVRVYNRLIGFKGMYLKIEEYSKSSLTDNIGVLSFFTSNGAYSKTERKEYEDVYGEFVLAVGYKGQNKTGWIANISQSYIDSLKQSTPLIAQPEKLNELGIKKGFGEFSSLIFEKKLDEIKSDLIQIEQKNN
jgi:uncharacterized protein involved in tolerance to divalent cations